YLFDNSVYLHSFSVTAVFALATTFLTLVLSLYLAVKANQVLRGKTLYRAIITWPYAVAPAVAGVLWVFMFNPTVGLIAGWLDALGIRWNYNVNGDQAMTLLVLAAVWRQVPYNFIFFVAGLQAIP